MIKSIDNHPDQEVIAHIKELLRMAEKGHLKCFMAVYYTAKGDAGKMDAGKYDLDRMTGLLEQGKHDLLMTAHERRRNIPLGEDS